MNLLVAEVLQTAHHFWSYRVSHVTYLVIQTLTYYLLLIGLGNSVTQFSQTSSFQEIDIVNGILGFVIWRLAAGVITDAPAIVEEEARNGTLENMLLSHHSPLTIMSVRTLVSFCYWLVTTMILTAFMVFVSGGVTLALNLESYLIIFITLLGATGVGFMLAGLAINYKAVATITGLAMNLAVFLSGAIVPLEPLGRVFLILKYLFPMTWGIELLRDVTAYKLSLPEIEAIGLTLQSIVFLCIGFLSFHFGYQRAKQNGNLAHY